MLKTPRKPFQVSSEKIRVGQKFWESHKAIVFGIFRKILAKVQNNGTRLEWKQKIFRTTRKTFQVSSEKIRAGQHF